MRLIRSSTMIGVGALSLILWFGVVKPVLTERADAPADDAGLDSGPVLKTADRSERPSSPRARAGRPDPDGSNSLTGKVDGMASTPVDAGVSSVSVLEVDTVPTGRVPNALGNPDAVPRVIYGGGVPFLPSDLPPSALRRELEALPPAKLALALSRLSKISFHVADLASLHVDPSGKPYYKCSFTNAAPETVDAVLPVVEPGYAAIPESKDPSTAVVVAAKIRSLASVSIIAMVLYILHPAQQNRMFTDPISGLQRRRGNQYGLEFLSGYCHVGLPSLRYGWRYQYIQ